MRMFLTLILAVCYTFQAFSQNTSIDWNKTVGGDKDDFFKSIAAHPNGDIYLLGRSESDSSGNKDSHRYNGSQIIADMWLTRLTTNGVKTWDRIYGGTTNIYPTSVITSPDNHLILGAHTDSDSSDYKSVENIGSYDYWIIKTDLEGEIIWDRTLGGTGIDEQPYLASTADNEIIVAGSSNSDKYPPFGSHFNHNRFGLKSENSFGGYDYWVLKLDSSGSVKWQRTLGGSEDDKVTAVSITDDGNVIVVGTSESGISGNKATTHFGESDIWFVKLDVSNGATLWQKTYGGSGKDIPKGMISFDDGTIMVGATSYSDTSGNKSAPNKSSPPKPDYWVIRLNENGDKIWDKTYGGTDYDTFYSIVKTLNNKVFLVGRSDSPAGGDKSEGFIIGTTENYWVIKTDTSGQIIWDKTYGVYNKWNNVESIQGVISPDNALVIGCSSDADISGIKTEGNYGGQDLFTFKIKESCYSTMILSGASMPNGVYRANETIRSTAHPNSPTTYQAGRYIELNDGFLVESGSIFTAKIAGCLD